MILIKNGTVFPMVSAPIPDGAVLIEDDKIAEVEEAGKLIAKIKNRTNMKIIDAQGGWILPGLIESHCHVGIVADKKGMEEDGCNEIYNPVTPYLSALDGINPGDAAFEDAVRAGITTLMIGPGSSNVVGGQFILMKTHGRIIDDMVMLAPAAMKVAFGENPVRNYKSLERLPSTRMAVAAMLREELFNAMQYKQEKEEAALQKKPFKEIFRYETWLPVLNKQIPLKAHVHRADDIMTAMRIAKEFDLDITLDHCTEGYLVADRIAKEGIPAIVGPFESFRSKIELENLNFANAGQLHKAGVLLSITTDHPVCLIQSLPLCAGLAVRAGLPMEEGLRAITLNPAKICRVDHRIGALAPGMDADISVYSGNPMETFTNTLYTIIDGQIVYSAHA